MVLLDADGRPITGNDDFIDLNAGFELEVVADEIYNLWLTSFEGAGSGAVILSRE
jgi:hypothetical protein